jgi:SmpA / OmlA family
MKARIPLILIGVFGLASFSVAQDTEIAGLVSWICRSAVAQDEQTKQALRIEVGSATREDVARLLGKPGRTSNDADCEAEQYGETWEYVVNEANGKFSRIHVAFDKDGKVSVVAKIPQRGKPVVLTYAAEKEHRH